MWSRLRAYFLTGLVVIAPIGITLYLTWLVIDSADGLVRWLLPASYSPEVYLKVWIPGIGLLIVLAFITLVGALAANLFGRAILRFGEGLVARMPVIRGIYSTIKQIFETVMSQSEASFREVVLIEYPRKGIWAMGFVSSPTRGEIGRAVGEDSLNVFLPTTPNPTSGFLLFVPRKDCIVLDMSVDQAIKYIISAGLVAPESFLPKPESDANREDEKPQEPA